MKKKNTESSETEKINGSIAESSTQTQRKTTVSLNQRIREGTVEEVVEEAVEQFIVDFDWLGEVELSDRAKSLMVSRITDAVRSRLRNITDEYIKQLEDENDRLSVYEQDGEMRNLRQTIENRDLLIKAMLFDLNEGAEYQTEEGRLRDMLDYNLILANNNGNPSAEVVSDEELEQRDFD